MGALFTYIKDRKLPILCAFFHWFFLQVMQVDRNFFLYSEENRVMIVSKILAFFLLVFIWNTIFNLYRDRKKGNAFAKRFIDLFGIYFLFLCLLLLLLWPGTWANDDLVILQATQYYRLFPWQHILTGYEHIVFLQLFPSMGGYVLVKNFLIAGIAAYVICKIESVFYLRKVFTSYWCDTLVKLLPFMLPPVLLYQFSGLRIGLYIYLELLMLSVMICSMKGAYQWNGFRILIFSLLIAVCAVWRSESFFYVVLGIGFYAASKNATFSKRMRVAGVVCLILFFVGLSRCQMDELGSAVWSYQLVSTTRPAVELIRRADVVKDAHELEKIDKVIKIDVVKEHPEYKGLSILYHDGIRSFTKLEYQEYFQNVLMLAVRYPTIALKERMSLFMETSGIYGQAVNISHMTLLTFDPDYIVYKEASQSLNNKLSKIVTEQKYPVFKNLRSIVLKCIGMGPLRVIGWNIIVPMIILVIGFFLLLTQKKWWFSFLLAIILLKISIVWLTAPEILFFYYLSFYFLGYVLFHFYVLHWLQSRKEKAL